MKQRSRRLCNPLVLEFAPVDFFACRVLFKDLKDLKGPFACFWFDSCVVATGFKMFQDCLRGRHLFAVTSGRS